MKNDSVLVDFKFVANGVEEIVEDEVVQLHNGLIDAGQAVWDTGFFKNNFSVIQKFSDWHWVIDNDAEYASILARGRREVGGKMYGSEKWAGGLDPMIALMEKNIERRSDAVRV